MREGATTHSCDTPHAKTTCKSTC